MPGHVQCHHEKAAQREENADSQPAGVKVAVRPSDIDDVGVHHQQACQSS